MKQDMEAKAQQLLVTQARYVDAARLRHPAWATAAGYQMAALYKEMYDAIMDAPAPPMTAEMHKVYVEELRKMIEPLLRRAIHAHELTLQVGERTGVDNEWVRRSNEQLEALRALVTPQLPEAPGSPGAGTAQPPARPSDLPTAPPPGSREPSGRGLM